MRILLAQSLATEEVTKKLRSSRRRHAEIERPVSKIIRDVRRRGDSALFDLARKLDGVNLSSLVVTGTEMDEAMRGLDVRLLRALKRARRNIAKFHRHHFQQREAPIETEKGVKVWREFRPIDRVGLYIPGGIAAYGSTVLMLAVPAQIAGCKEIMMATPPSESGRCHAAVLAAASLCGIRRIFKIGGAQAVAAMAFGTETVPRVYKIFGPGNRYVTCAKMQVYGTVDIDMPAGPSELLVIADDQAEAPWIAADLLAQLEHGGDSQGVLVTPSKDLARTVIEEIRRQTVVSSRKDIIERAANNSLAIVVDSIAQACAIANEYAPEHLHIMAKEEKGILRKIRNAGSVFLGRYAAGALGDYATGTNHTLPTSGYARVFSPLSTQSFGKTIQVQKVTREGIKRLRETVETLAASEGLEAHRTAVAKRFGSGHPRPGMPSRF